MDLGAGDVGHVARSSETSTAAAVEGGRRKAETVRAQAGAARGPTQQTESSMRPAKQIEWNGKTQSASAWARELGASASGVLYRDKMGKNPDGSPRSEVAKTKTKKRKATGKPRVAEVVFVPPPPATIPTRLKAVAEAMGFTATDAGEVGGWNLLAWRSAT